MGGRLRTRLQVSDTGPTFVHRGKLELCSATRLALTALATRGIRGWLPANIHTAETGQSQNSVYESLKTMYKE